MPNVVLLMSDEHNPRYASPYGHTAIQTPAMKRLAREGVVFDAAYCPSPLCLPSRSAMMAGKRVHELQTYSNCNANLDPAPSYGAALAQQGVHTVYVGKTDVYAPGDSLGFSEMVLPGDRAWPGDVNHRRNPMTIRAGAANRAKGYGPRESAAAGDLRCVDAAEQWLRHSTPQLDRPWVLVVNVTNPHFPHYASPDLWDLYPQGGDLPAYGPELESARHPYAISLRDHFETHDFAEDDVRGLRRGYLACISFVDRQLDRLMTTLEELGLRDDTVVMYTSDHGEMLGKFGMWWKCSLYEDAVRVPVIAAGPGFKAGTRVTTPVDLLDVQATLFAVTGASQPEDRLGTPLQMIPVDDRDRVIFAEYHGHGTRGSSFMVRRGEWKLIYHVGAPPQLFDLASDPEELHNVHDACQVPAAELEAALREFCSPEVEHSRAEAFIEAQLAVL